MSKSFSPDIILNVKAPHNRNVLFWPDGNIELRSSVVLKAGQNNNVVAVAGGEIPGHQVQIDTKTRTVKIVDRMGFPENKGKRDELLKLAETEDFKWRVGRLGVQDTIEREVSEYDWPTWLFHFKRIYDHGRLERVKGNLPTYQEISLLGKVYRGDSCDISSKDPAHPHNVVSEHEFAEFSAREMAHA